MIKNILRLFTRIKKKLSCYKNRYKLNIYGIKYGNNCIIHGHIGIKKAKQTNFIIGNNFYMSSGNHINPLARNSEASLCINQGASIIIGNNVGMSSPVIWSHKSIKIGNNVMLGANVIIMDSDAHSLNYLDRRNPKFDRKNKKDVEVIIEDDVFIGMNSIIMKGVRIGARTIIGASSVVTKSIPSDCIVCGNPAKIIKQNLNS